MKLKGGQILRYVQSILGREKCFFRSIDIVTVNSAFIRVEDEMGTIYGIYAIHSPGCEDDVLLLTSHVTESVEEAHAV